MHQTEVQGRTSNKDGGRQNRVEDQAVRMVVELPGRMDSNDGLQRTVGQIRNYVTYYMILCTYNKC